MNKRQANDSTKRKANHASNRPTDDIPISSRRPTNPVAYLASLPPVLMLLIILGTAVIVTMIVMDDLNSRTQSLTQPQGYAYQYHSFRDMWIYRHHPRACTLAMWAFYSSPIWMVMLMSTQLGAGWRKRGELKPVEKKLKLEEYLDAPLKLELPVTPDEAFDALEQLDGVEVKSPDTRAAHWTITERNKNDRAAKFELRYTHNPLAIKPWRLYARTITCEAKVEGGGMSAYVVLKFHANSAMDYEAVQAMIERTKEAVNAAAMAPKAAV